MFGLFKKQKQENVKPKEEAKPQGEGMYTAIYYRDYFLGKKVIDLKIKNDAVRDVICEERSIWWCDIYGNYLKDKDVDKSDVLVKNSFWLTKEEAVTIQEMRQKNEFPYDVICSSERFDPKSILRCIDKFKEVQYRSSEGLDKTYETEINGYSIKLTPPSAYYEDYNRIEVTKDKYKIYAHLTIKKPVVLNDTFGSDVQFRQSVHEYSKLIDFYTNFPSEQIKQWIEKIEEEMRMNRKKRQAKNQ